MPWSLEELVRGSSIRASTRRSLFSSSSESMSRPADARPLRLVDVRQQLGAVLVEPLDALVEARVAAG